VSLPAALATDPDVTWLPTLPNLLPVDPADGGQALYFDWWLDDTTAVVPGGTGLATYAYLPAGDHSLTTRQRYAQPVPLPVTGGEDYQFTTTSTGPILIELYGVRSDDTPEALGADWHPGGTTHRSTVTRSLPVGYVGLAVRIVCPAAADYSFNTDPLQPGQLLYRWLDLWGVQQVGSSWETDGQTLPDPGAGVTVSDPVLVRGFYDPGPVPPTGSVETFGTLVWGSLPELYRRVDGQQSPAYPLLHYLQGAGVGSDDTIAVAREVYGGAMTDPVACPDAWLGWLVAVLGIISAPNPADQRAAIQARQTAARPGTAANLEAYIQTLLSGSKFVVVSPSSTAWILRVQVIDAETTPIGGTAALATRIRASNKLPAGYDVSIQPLQIAWDAADTRYGATWSPADEAITNWADLDSTGLGG